MLKVTVGQMAAEVVELAIGSARPFALLESPLLMLVCRWLNRCR